MVALSCLVCFLIIFFLRFGNLYNITTNKFIKYVTYFLKIIRIALSVYIMEGYQFGGLQALFIDISGCVYHCKNHFKSLTLCLSIRYGALDLLHVYLNKDLFFVSDVKWDKVLLLELCKCWGRTKTLAVHPQQEIKETPIPIHHHR